MATREVPVGKIPPQNLDAEKSLLGAVLIDEETLADISEHVTVKDFYEKRDTNNEQRDTCPSEAPSKPCVSLRSLDEGGAK